MASIRKRKTRQGYRYDVRYRSPDGKTRGETFRTRREADQRLHAIEVEKARGGWLDPRLAARLFGDLAEEWFAANPEKRSSSRARDRSILDKHVLPTFGTVPVGQVSPRMVQSLVAGWGGRMRPRSVRRCYDVLRAVFNYAVDTEVIARSPCRGVKLPPAASETRRVPTADELARLADEIGDNAPMVYAGALLGFRWGEVAGLRVGRIDFLTGTIEVAEQLTRGEHGRHVVGPPKSEAGRRTVAAPRALLDMLAAHLARRGITGADKGAFVFVSPNGAPLDYSHWRRRVWLPACARAGLHALTFHDLRRTAATALVLEGVDLKTAQTRLGHSDPRLTLGLYAQASREADRDAADRVGDRFLPDAWHDRGMESDSTS